MTTDVPTIITSQQTYVTDWLAQANAFVDRVATLANTTFPVTTPTLGYGRTGITDGAESKLSALRPTRPTIPDITGTVPEVPEFTFSDLVPVEVLDLAASAPSLNIPSVPSSTLPDAPSAPTINAPTLPDSPVLSFPTAPTLVPPTLPETPSIELPYFISALPVDDLIVPTNSFEFYEEAYSSATLDAVKAKLLADLTDGGYGIETSDEADLWERARARETAGAQQAVEDILVFHSQRSFALPPGEITVAVSRAQQALADRLSGVNRDIALKRADMYVENRKFTIAQTRELEQVLIGYHNSVMERALNVQKAILESTITIYNATVARYNARLEAYKVSAQVFEARIRAALTQVEIFKAQMDGKRLEVEIQRSQVEVYRAQLSAIESIVGIFRTRMEAARVQTEVERSRIDAFRAQVDAYGQQVQAKVAEFNMYRSQIEGETAKVTAFRAQVDSYTAQVNAAKIRTDVQVAALTAQVEQARIRVAAYNAQIEQFKANLSAQVEAIRSTTEVYRADISAFSAGVEAIRSAYQVEIAELNSNTQWNIKVAEVNTDVARLNLQSLQAAAAIRIDAAKFGTKFYQEVVAATLGSITTLAAQVQSV